MFALLLAAQAQSPIMAQPSLVERARVRAEEQKSAELKAEAARHIWVDCIQRRKIALRPSRERISDVVTAVLSGCATEQGVYRDALPIRFDFAEQVIVRARQGYSDALTGFYVEDRLKRTRR
jgi:hypothetical protein